MKTALINIRDPYILQHSDQYYLYGTRSAECWGEATGFDVYVSKDLENWEGPFEIFKRPEDFFAHSNFWAPECYAYNRAFYLLTTLGASNMKKGVYVLKSDSPLGPFEPYGKRLTPEDWTCIDGTLYFEGEIPYMIFSHSFEDVPDGDMCIVQLSKDLSEAISEPVKLFSAKDTSWAHPIPFAHEFNMTGDVYFTDGPCVVKLPTGALLVVWSSWGTCGYTVGMTFSESGSITGPWKHLEKPLFGENGGHGMMFVDKEGIAKYTMHYPNDKYKEHPVFFDLILEADKVKLQ